MGIRVAHGEKDNIQSAILSGAIPKESIIFTSDNEETTEIFFYDALGSLKSVATGSGSGTEELSALAEKVAANAVAIETESKQRSDADAGIMALINQLAGNHTADIEGLRSADAALQAEINKAHEHANKAVLDGITQNMVDAWNTADTGYTEAEVTAMWNEVFGA